MKYIQWSILNAEQVFSTFFVRKPRGLWHFYIFCPSLGLKGACFENLKTSSSFWKGLMRKHRFFFNLFGDTHQKEEFIFQCTSWSFEALHFIRQWCAVNFHRQPNEVPCINLFFAFHFVNDPVCKIVSLTQNDCSTLMLYFDFLHDLFTMENVINQLHLFCFSKILFHNVN